jgi:hypothetical protein
VAKTELDDYAFLRKNVPSRGCVFRNTAPTPTGFAEIVSDNLPVLHKADSALKGENCVHSFAIKLMVFE